MRYELALPLILAFSVGSLLVAGFLASWVLKRDTGTSAMQAISNAIKEGAELVTGGTGRPEGLNRGYFVRPTIFANVTPDIASRRTRSSGLSWPSCPMTLRCMWCGWRTTPPLALPPMSSRGASSMPAGSPARCGRR